MKIFISWSGGLSERVAKLFNEWIPCVLQAVRPWVSSEIDRGAVWLPEIEQQLAESRVGIFCVTKENKEAPWLLFEAGALRKGLAKNLVMTFLIDLQDTDIRGPLQYFNHTRPDRNGVRQLVGTINSALTVPLERQTLERVFETFWSGFENDFAEILKCAPPSEASAPLDRNEEMLTEVLSSVRQLSARVNRIELNAKSPNESVLDFRDSSAETSWKINDERLYIRDSFLKKFEKRVRDVMSDEGIDSKGMEELRSIAVDEYKMSIHAYVNLLAAVLRRISPDRAHSISFAEHLERP